MAKGSQFERDICKKLSAWWSEGETDDIFWRSSQSGGRATQRAKSGKETFGSWGDIAAVNPIGLPLLKLVTIELKRGRSHGYPGDLLDFKAANGSHPWVKCALQAIRCAEAAKSFGWMMICRRDHRVAVVFLQLRVAKMLRLHGAGTELFSPPCMSFQLRLQGLGAIYFVGLPLDDFLKRVTPECVRLAQQSL